MIIARGEPAKRELINWKVLLSGVTVARLAIVEIRSLCHGVRVTQ